MKYKTLTKDNYQEYLYKVYSAWLGKIIGIRLGAPVEGWDDKKIFETYKEKHGYLLDYGIFAADDDSNGPLLFVRSLLEKKNINAEDIGNCFLNYIQEYSGFFWWGGVGVSSEHTAYENLKNGIKAPKSGSYLTNGKAIAEQIGGQIFSDCWGYVAGYNPETAKKLASMASSVTHDLDGIEGGIFVAVAICLAMQYTDIHEVVLDALEFIDTNSHYYKVMHDIINFYNINPDDYKLCFKYIKDNYGYDKYPGVCHIIPNACLMIMAMMYGNNDFDATMEMLNNCGWDTDCNCGNVGSILGGLLGINNISEKWIKPNNDIVNASSCIGSLNIQTISESSKLFAKLAYKLVDIDIEDNKHFDLPYATEGFFGDVKVSNGLKCNGEVYKYTYYLGKDIYDSRYDPEFSPIVYPGYTISVIADKDIQVFAEDLDNNRYIGFNCLTIPNGKNRFIHKIGFIGDNYTIFDIKIEHTPKVEYDFTKLPYDIYGPRYEGDDKYNIRGFVKHSGDYKLDNGLNGKGFITIGHLKDKFNSIEYSFVPDELDGHFVLFNCQGYMHYSALGFLDNELVLIRKNNETKVEKKWPINWEKSSKSLLKMSISIDKISICVDGHIYEYECDLKLSSLVGIFDTKNNHNIGLKLQ